MPDGDARRGGDYPPDVLVVPVPQLDAKGKVRGDVVEVGVRQLAKQSVHSEIEVGGRAPQMSAFLAELFEQPEGVELAVAV